MPLGPNTKTTAKMGWKGPMLPVASTHLSSASTPHDLRDDAKCTIHAAPPLVLRADWETLAQLASRKSKPLDLDACPTPSSTSHQFCGATTNHSLLHFESQTKKPSWWFWGPNHQTIAVSLEAMITQLSWNNLKVWSTKGFYRSYDSTHPRPKPSHS
jgi:hypothetical protein